jgi:prepilin-type N-terminal cleavage/methylation domain-containing protein
MKKNKGFTLIELMVVILIIAILAAVLAPMMSGRIRSAKWAEGRAGAGTIATALRAYVAEHEGAGDLAAAPITGTGMSMLGIDSSDLNGKYFIPADYEITSYAISAGGEAANPAGFLSYVITVTPTGSWANEEQITLTTTGPSSQNVWAGPTATGS